MDGTGRQVDFYTQRHKWHKSIKIKDEKIEETEFKPERWTPYACLISKETLPNGNFLEYTYDRFMDDKYHPTYYRVKSITAYSKNKTKMGALEFSYLEKENNRIKNCTAVVVIKGSDQRHAIYDFHYKEIFRQEKYNKWTQRTSVRTDGLLFLSNSKSPSHPNIAYRYDNNFQIDLTGRPDGRIFHTVYGPDRKVKAQYAPIGTGGKLEAIAEFQYEKGMTKVTDGEGNLTCFRYDENDRLMATEKYEGKTLYRVEKNVWKESGELESQSIEDAHGEIFKKIEYEYDSRGNVLFETVSGINGLPYRIERTYSDDIFNLKLSEKDGLGKEVKYSYLPGTNLCLSELTYDRNLIRKRVFHFYDDCAFV